MMCIKHPQQVKALASVHRDFPTPKKPSKLIQRLQNIEERLSLLEKKHKDHDPLSKEESDYYDNL